MEQQTAVERERTRIAQDIHDDLGARLTRISLLSELARRDSTHIEEVRSNVGKIAESATELVRAMDEIVWAIDPTKDTLDNLVNYLVSFSEEFLHSTTIRLRLDLPESLPDLALTAEVRHNIFLVVKEAFNNLIKHSGAAEVRLRVAWDGRCFVVVVEDDGRGIDSATLAGRGRSKGNGLGNMRERMRGLGGTCEVVSEPGKGTRLTLSLELTDQPVAV